MEERQGRMIKASVSLQELRRKIYSKAKTEKHWKFWGLWGLYCHICKKEVTNGVRMGSSLESSHFQKMSSSLKSWPGFPRRNLLHPQKKEFGEYRIR